MAKARSKGSARPRRGAGTASESRRPGRPPRAPGKERRQIVVDTALLEHAMRLTGRGQSDTVNAALAQLAENAAILEGAKRLLGAFPDYRDPD